MAEVDQHLLDCVNQCAERVGFASLLQTSDLFQKANGRFLLTYQELDPYRRPSSEKYWGLIDSQFGDEVDWGNGAGKRIFAYLRHSDEFEGQIEVLSAKTDSAIVASPNCPVAIVAWAKSKNVEILTQPVAIPHLLQHLSLIHI